MKFSQEELDAVAKLFDGKRGTRSIAKELGVSRHRIICIYKELGIDNSNVKPVITRKISNEILESVKSLFNGKRTAQNIADQLGIKLRTVRSAYKNIGIDASVLKGPPRKEIPTNKICKKCGQDKLICCFRQRINGKNKSNINYECYCKDCERISGLQRFKKSASWENRRKNSLQRLRSNISRSVRSALDSVGQSKNGSVLDFLPYTIRQLKENIESKFEPWMNWDNHGRYNSEIWDDNNVLTWTWQIDHIIPQSDLPYSSMQDENFKKCWDLSNLRPLSSKQNLLDGVRKTRHKTVLSIAA